ncbi:ABC transporter ATP-binding protein [Candidatus Legionella polyplacis]|uniref:ABC transporter ATP-binding protein n=1 Tax=Candidatus Legionella polyplacis TaxID=2005262 RepID=A0ABZ2H157_9GAMM
MLAIQIKNLYKTYSNGFNALQNINLNINPGDFFALLGSNGAGKSTTIGIITTLLKKTSGNIYIYNNNLDKHPKLAKSYMGLVPQEFNLNIFENSEQILINQAGYYGMTEKETKPRMEWLLKTIGLWKNRKLTIRYLSGGMKRQLMIARALIHEPKILILDEPTAGIDIENRHNMWSFLTKTNQEGTTILLTTHYLEEAEQLCKNIAIIHKGIIVYNTSIKTLLKTLKKQIFIFNTKQPFQSPPKLKSIYTKKIDNYTFEIHIENNYSLNEIFNSLSKNGFIIHSMRNKTNRLETLFLDLINNQS